MAEPKKTVRSDDVNKNSFVYKFCFSVCKWFLVSLLFYLCSIPVFTIGTAGCTAVAEFRDGAQDIRDIFRSWFSHFARYFKKTVPFFLLFLLVLCLLILNLSFYNQFAASGSVLYYSMMGINIVLILTAVSLLRFYNYEVTLETDVSFKQRVRNAFLRMMKCLPAAGMLCLLDIALAATLAAAASVVTPILFIYPGIHAFLTCLLIAWFDARGGAKEEK